MVDEAQRLTRRQRIQLFGKARRIVLGTHRCFRRQLQASGYTVHNVTLDEIPDVDWLKAALQQKIDSARRSKAAPRLRISDDTVLKLIAEFGNNIRGMERNLYEAIHNLKFSSGTHTSI